MCFFYEIFEKNSTYLVIYIFEKYQFNSQSIDYESGSEINGSSRLLANRNGRSDACRMSNGDARIENLKNKHAPVRSGISHHMQDESKGLSKPGKVNGIVLASGIGHFALCCTVLYCTYWPRDNSRQD